MSRDAQCVGICMIDPDTGACLGCGRLPEEIAGIPLTPPASESPAAGLGLPANVVAQVGEGSD
jgi:hypothetical protein